MNLYVGNVSRDLSEDSLRTLFEEFGQVESARLIVDKNTSQPRGFGFVEMIDQKSALIAIQTLHDKEVGGRRLIVNEAKPKRSFPRGH